MTEVRNATCEVRPCSRLLHALVFGCVIAIFEIPAFAEVKVIETESAYAIKNNIAVTEARRIAVLEAKHKALDQAAAFTAGIEAVRNSRLSSEKIRAYTAGVLETQIIADENRGSGQVPEVYIKTRSSLDTDSLMTAIGRYHQQQELEDQLQRSLRERDKLRIKRIALARQLALVKNSFNAGKTQKKLEAVLAKEEVNQDVHILWTNLGHTFTEFYDEEPATGPETLNLSVDILEKAVKADPQNQRAHCLLASVYQRQGNYAAAEREAGAAIQRNPSNPIPHLKLGILLRMRGSNKEALKEFHFVERLRPHNTAMLYYAGMTSKDMKRCGMSIHYLQRFLKDKQISKLPGKAQRAREAINECGGARGGYQQRTRSSR